MEFSGEMSEPVLWQQDCDGIITLQLNRPSSLNCMSGALLTALENAFLRIADDPTAKCVVLTGAGKAFCAGHDLREMRANAGHEYYRSFLVV